VQIQGINVQDIVVRFFLISENLPHTSGSQQDKIPSPQAGKPDIHSASSATISEGLYSVRKTDPKTDAGHNQEVIEGTKVTLNGTESKIGEDGGLSYSWEQVNGPKVRIVDADTAIASFEAPKIPSGRDKLTMKFVLLVTDDSGSNARSSNNNDKDSKVVIVKQESSLDYPVNQGSSSSADNKDRPASQAQDKVHSNDAKYVDNIEDTKDNDKGRSEETKKQESDAQQKNEKPIDTTDADTNNGDTSSQESSNNIAVKTQ